MGVSVLGVPPHYPPYQTCHRRFQLWGRSGILDQILRALAQEAVQVPCVGPGGFGRLKRCDLGLVGGGRRIEEDAQRHGQRRLEGGQQTGQLRVGLVVAQDARRIGGHDLEADGVLAQTQALVAIGAEQKRLAVRDDGPGIPPEQQGLIFEKFGRAAAGGAKPGTGLGLFIARSIAQAHGGSLEVASVPGRGATFTLTLPI